MLALGGAEAGAIGATSSRSIALAEMAVLRAIRRHVARLHVARQAQGVEVAPFSTVRSKMANLRTGGRLGIDQPPAVGADRDLGGGGCPPSRAQRLVLHAFRASDREF